MSDEKPKRLSLEDPVNGEILQQLRQLHDARLHMCERAVDLEQERIQILAAVKRLDDQKQRMFDAILVERGIPPQTQVEIDGRTGGLRMLSQSEPVKAEEPVEAED